MAYFNQSVFGSVYQEPDVYSREDIPVYDDPSAEMIVVEGKPPAPPKKKFPWLALSLGAAVLGVVLYKRKKK